MEKKVLTPEEKKVLKSMFFRSHLVFTSFNMVKMEANGFTITIAPAIESIYKDDMEGKRSAYHRRGHRHWFVRGRFNPGDFDLHPALWCNAVYREVFLCELGLCLWDFVY